MIELLYKFSEQVTSPSIVGLALLFSILAAFVASVAVYKVVKSETITISVLSFIVMQIFLIGFYNTTKYFVKSYRLDKIKTELSNISLNTYGCKEYTNRISNWNEGLEAIRLCPSQEGYYIKTADLLEKEKDYHSAAILLIMGLDFIQKDPPPIDFCDRLRRYSNYVPNIPTLNEDCIKIHDN